MIKAIFITACVIASTIIQTEVSAIDFEESWTAQEKQDAIWSRIVLKGDNSNTWWLFPVKPLSLFLHNFNLSFERTDFLQKQWWSLWTIPRWKAIHTVGVVQKIRWEPESGQPYTGVFEGDQFGIVRYSSGLGKSFVNQKVLPGAVFKFFRDGIYSANMHTVSRGSQTTTNFFQRTFQNHIAESRTNFVQLAGGLFATGESHFPLTVGTKNFATYNQQGQEASNVKFPFRVVYVPQVATSIRDSSEDVTFQEDLVDSLKTVNQLLFKVYAYEYPQDIKDISKLLHIGNIYSESEAVNSLWADDNLHFPHMPIEEDLKSNPSWEAYIPRFTPNIFKIEWGQETNPDYVPSGTPSVPTVGSSSTSTLREYFASWFEPQQQSGCPYGFH